MMPVGNVRDTVKHENLVGSETAHVESSKILACVVGGSVSYLARSSSSAISHATRMQIKGRVNLGNYSRCVVHNLAR